jgi:ATP-dependent exoDNAse (exonuclease V) beta subunit
MVIQGNSVLIVDYKSSRPADSAEYHQQIQEYAAILRDIYPGHEMRGVLLYLDDLTLEEVALV